MNKPDIHNQDEVTRLRQLCFKKHGCMGYWKPEFAFMTLAELIDTINTAPGNCLLLTKVRNALKRLM